MTPKRILISLLPLLALSQILYGQTGGSSVYTLLNLAPTARSASLGGFFLSTETSDPALAYHNPALVNPAMHQQLSLNYANYIAGINYGYLSYGMDYGKFGTWSAGIQYLNYGRFTEADEYGEITGTFSAAEYTLNLSGAFHIDSLFQVGVTIRPIYSVLERYQSWGLSADLGILYHSRNGRTGISAVLRNLGTQFSTYATPEREPLPYEILVAFSHKIEYAPFRLVLTARNVQKYQLREGNVAQTLLDHLTAGVEFVPGKIISIRFAYNFLRRSELQPELINTAAGLSFGGGLNLGWLRIDYALVNYHPAARTHLLSAGVDIASLTKKKAL